MPALIATGVLIALGASEAGFHPTSWYAAGLFLLGLLVVTLFTLGVPRGLPRTVLAALLLFAAYTGWTYLSIIWAGRQGAAWEGANRTAVYLVVLALFALWPFDARGVRIVLGALGLGIAALGMVELLRAGASAQPAGFFIDVRFSEPAGYMNANAALWTLGLLPCLYLAAAREVPAPLRGAALGGAGLLASLALMAQSRGWVLALPLALIAWLIFSPRRVRLAAAIAAAAAGTLAVSGPVLAIHDDYSPERLGILLADATAAVLTMAGVLALLGTAAALVDRRVSVGATAARRLGRVVGAIAAIALVGACVVFVAGAGQSGHQGLGLLGGVQARRRRPAGGRLALCGRRDQSLRVLDRGLGGVPGAPGGRHRRRELPGGLPEARQERRAAQVRALARARSAVADGPRRRSVAGRRVRRRPGGRGTSPKPVSVRPGGGRGLRRGVRVLAAARLDRLVLGVPGTHRGGDRRARHGRRAGTSRSDRVAEGAAALACSRWPRWEQRRWR